MPDMINPQKGIDLMNNKSIINRILFAVTIFQHIQFIQQGEEGMEIEVALARFSRLF
jgi:hypothetical protein